MAIRSIFGPDGNCGPGNCDAPTGPVGSHGHIIPDVSGLPERLAQLAADIENAGAGVDGIDGINGVDGVDGVNGADGIGAGGAVLLDNISANFNGVRLTFPLRINGAIIPQDTVMLVSLNGILQHVNVSYTLGNVPLEISFVAAPHTGWSCQLYAFSKGLNQGGTGGGTTPGGAVCITAFNQAVAPTLADNPCPNAIWLNSVTGTIYTWSNGTWVMFNPKPQYGVESGGSLPTTGNYEGRIFYLEADGRLYIFKNGQWILFSTYLTPDAPAGIEVFASNPTTGNYEGRVIFNTTTNKLMKFVGGVWMQVIEPTGAAAEVADGSINTAKFAAGIRPVELVDVLPTTGNFEGRIVYNKQDDKLYRYTGTAWTAATAAADITGTLRDTQIGTNSINTGHLQADAVTSAKLVAGSVIAGKIAAGAVSTTELSAGAVTTEKLFARSITSEKIAALAIKAENLAADSVTADKLTANAVTAGKIQAGAIGTTQLAAQAVSTEKLGANAVVAGTIAANAVTSAKLAAGAVTTEKLSVGGAGNIIWNPCLYRSSAGWEFAGSVGPNAFGSAMQLGAHSWYPSGIGAGMMNYGGAGQYWSNQYLIADWKPVAGIFGIACSPGEKWQARALLGTHRCDGQIQIIFSDGNNTVLSQVGTPSTNDLPGGGYDAAFRSHEVLAVAPAGAVRVMFRVIGIGNGGTTPHVFFTKCMLSKAPNNATQVAPWSAGSTEIHGGMLVTQSIMAEHIAAGQITTNHLAAGTITADKLTAGEIITNSIQIRNLAVERPKIQLNAVSTLQGTERYEVDMGERYVPGSLTAGNDEAFQSLWVDINNNGYGAVKFNFSSFLDISFDQESNGAQVLINRFIRWSRPAGGYADFAPTFFTERPWLWIEEGVHNFQYVVNYKATTAEGWNKWIRLGGRYMYVQTLNR